MGHKPPVWKGSNALVLSPTSPEFDDTPSGRVYTMVWEGPYAIVAAATPARLQKLASKSIPDGFLVDTVKRTKAPGGRGQLTVTCVVQPYNSVDGDDVLELEWTEVQKKLETHPRYITGGSKELSETDLNDLEFWRDCRDSVLRAGFKYVDDNKAQKTLSANATDFAKKVLRGQDSYVVYSPVCRVTTITTTKPKCGRCGRRSNPPADIRVDGYEYLKTSDRASRQSRKWTRIQEWTGADSIDHDIYPE